MSRYWKYKGRRVTVAPTADIPAEYREGSRGHTVVQTVLDDMEWREDPIETVFDMDPLPEIVIRVGSRVRRWAKHVGHRARNVQLSPFVVARKSWTSSFTVELVGLVDNPLLVRAYPGEYIPPLPWQRSAEYADGGLEACKAFWREHAYVYRPSRVVTGSETGITPVWFSQ